MADTENVDEMQDLGEQTQDDKKRKQVGGVPEVPPVDPADSAAVVLEVPAAGDGTGTTANPGDPPSGASAEGDHEVPEEGKGTETSEENASDGAPVGETPVEENDAPATPGNGNASNDALPVGETPVGETPVEENKVEEKKVEPETPAEQPEETAGQTSRQSAQASPPRQQTQSAGPSEEEVDKERRRMERRMAWDTTGNALGAALATAPGALGEGAGQMIGSVTRLMDSFFRDGPMSAPSRVLGEALSGADTAARLGRQAAEAYGIAENADRSALKGTYQGRMLEARDRAQRQGIARAHLEIARLGGDDLSQLDEDGLDRVEQGLAARRSALAERLAEDHRIREARRDADPLRSSMGMQVMGAPMPTMTPAERREALAEIASIDDVSKGIGSARRSMRSQAAEQARRDKRLKAQAYDEYYDTRATPLQRFVMDAMGRRDVDWDGDVPADRRMHGRAFRALLDQANMMPAGDPNKANLEQLAAAYGRSYKLRRETDEQRARREAKEQAERDYASAYAQADPYKRAWFDETARGRTKRVAPEFDGDIPKDHMKLKGYERFARARAAQSTDPQEQQEWLARAEQASRRRLQLGTAPDDWAHYESLPAGSPEKLFMERFGMKQRLDAEGMPRDPALDQRWANELIRLGRTEEAVHVMATSAARRSDPLSGVFREMESSMRNVRNELMLKGIDPSPLYTPGFKGLDDLVKAHPGLRGTVAAYAATVASVQGMHALGALRRTDLVGAKAVAQTEFNRLMNEAKQAVAGGASPEETYRLLQAKMIYMDLRAQTLLKGGLDEKFMYVLPKLIANADPNSVAARIGKQIETTYKWMGMTDESKGRGMVLPKDISLEQVRKRSENLRVMSKMMDETIDQLRSSAAKVQTKAGSGAKAQAKMQTKMQAKAGAGTGVGTGQNISPAAKTIANHFKTALNGIANAGPGLSEADIGLLEGGTSLDDALAADPGMGDRLLHSFRSVVGNGRGYLAMYAGLDPGMQKIMDGVMEKAGPLYIGHLLDSIENTLNKGDLDLAERRLGYVRYASNWIQQHIPGVDAAVKSGAYASLVTKCDDLYDRLEQERKAKAGAGGAGAGGQNNVPPVDPNQTIKDSFKKYKVLQGSGVTDDDIDALTSAGSVKDAIVADATGTLADKAKRMFESARANRSYRSMYNKADANTRRVIDGLMERGAYLSAEACIKDAEKHLRNGDIPNAVTSLSDYGNVLSSFTRLFANGGAPDYGDLQKKAERYKKTIVKKINRNPDGSIDMSFLTDDDARPLQESPVVSEQSAEESVAPKPQAVPEEPAEEPAEEPSVVPVEPPVTGGSEVSVGEPVAEPETEGRSEDEIIGGLRTVFGRLNYKSNADRFAASVGKDLSDYRESLEDGDGDNGILMALARMAYVGFYDKSGARKTDFKFNRKKVSNEDSGRMARLADAYKNNRDKPEAELLAALKKAYSTEAERKVQQKLMDDESKAAEEDRKRNKMLLQDDEKRVEQPKKGGKNTPVKKYTDWIADARLSEGESMAKRIMEALDDLEGRKKASGNLKIVIGNWMNGVDAPKGFDKDVFAKDVEEYRKDPANNAKWEAAFPTKTSAEPPNPSGTASTGLTPEMIAQLDSPQSVVDEMTNFNLDSPGNGSDSSNPLLEKVVSDDRCKGLYDGLPDPLKGEVTGLMERIMDAPPFGITAREVMGELDLDGVGDKDKAAIQSLVMQAIRKKKEVQAGSMGKSVYSGLSQSDRMRLAARVIAARRLGADVDPGLLRETTAIAKSAVRSFIAKHPFRG